MSSSQRLFSALLLLLLFILAASFGGPANGVEQSIMDAAAGLRSSVPGLVKISAAVTILGGYPFTLGVAISATLILLARKQWRPALLLLATVLLERLVVELLKDWIGRPRPLLAHLPNSLAFPSGHSANSMTTYLAVALFAVPAPYRRTAAISAMILSVLVGITRIILGVHWPSDVIGGWTFGLMAVGLAYVAGEKSGTVTFKAKHEVVGGHLAPPGEDKSA